MTYVKSQQSTDYIKCLYCDEKDENKLLKKIFLKIELFIKIAMISS